MWFGKTNKASSASRKAHKQGDVTGQPNSPTASRSVIWDAAQDGSQPFSRRRFATRIALAMLAVPGLAAAEAAERQLRRFSNLKLAAKSCPASQRHSDSTGNHVDLPGPPHADGTPHSDICIPR